jgi:Sulfatase
MRKQFNVVMFIGVVVLALLSVAVQAADKKPNIVFILTDNLGYGEVGAYGGGLTRGAATPRIDSIAKEGMRFLNMNMDDRTLGNSVGDAFCAVRWCC